MHHKMHFGDNAFVRVELTKLLVMVADEALQESCTIVFDLGAEQPVYYLHHPEVIAPMLIILWDSVSNQQWQNTTKQPHLSSYNWLSFIYFIAVSLLVTSILFLRLHKFSQAWYKPDIPLALRKYRICIQYEIVQIFAYNTLTFFKGTTSSCLIFSYVGSFGS